MESPLTNISVAKRQVTADAAVEGNNTGSVGIEGRASGTGEATATAGALSGTFALSGTLTVTGDVKVTGTVDSAFLKKLRTKFIGPDPDNQVWPSDDAVDDEELAASEFIDAFRALFMLREDGVPPPAGAPGSAKQLIKELVDETGWPAFNENVAVPAPWNTPEKRDSFRRYEVSSAVDVLMRVYHMKGASAGGEPTQLPPDR